MDSSVKGRPVRVCGYRRGCECTLLFAPKIGSQWCVSIAVVVQSFDYLDLMDVAVFVGQHLA